jgi:hypothetical protein
VLPEAIKPGACGLGGIWDSYNNMERNTKTDFTLSIFASLK